MVFAFAGGIVLGIIALALHSVYICIVVHSMINAMCGLRHRLGVCTDCKHADSA